MQSFLTIFLVTVILFSGSTSISAIDKTSDSAPGINSASAITSSYDQFFTDQRLRIDLILAGNKEYQKVYLQGLKREPKWSGTRTKLVDPFRYGEYFYEIRTPEGEVIYSKGFSSLFSEWRTTDEAKKVEKAFTNCIWAPYPKKPCSLVIYQRLHSDGSFSELFRCPIDPADRLINPEKDNDFEVVEILDNGDPSHKVDLCFVAEGYRAEEMEKFIADCQKFTDYLFSMEPYKTRKADWNVWAVKSISQDSGTDIPDHDVWKTTIANSNFYTFYLDRYLTAPDHKSVAKIASEAPCDAIFVLVNEDKYGGGGIYNYYALGTNGGPFPEEVFIHEFGHSFAGLGDEYYDSSVAYENFYVLDVEPWEPNITSRVNFASKWESMLTKGTPIPTPNDPKYIGQVGLFEGAGYMSKGMYRPYFECRMLNNTAPCFCPVCQKAINAMIDYYVE